MPGRGMAAPAMTSILSLLNLTPSQAEAATWRGSDVAVTAGAGSGKTRALVGRYLSLLEDGLPLRSLVAITFTDKAAREMRTRIRATIERWLAEGPHPDLWQTAFIELDAARIGTIHSLCAAILRAHPAEAGVDPTFAVLEESTAAALQAQAVEAALAWATTDPGAARLFGLFTEQRLREVLAGLVSQRLDAGPAFTVVAADPLGRWANALAAWLERRLSVPEWTDALGTLDSRHAQTPGDKLELARREVLARWDEIQAALAAQDWDAAFDGLAALRGVVTSTAGAKANWHADDLAAVREAMATLRAHYDTGLIPLIGKDRAVRWALDQQVAQALPDLRRLFEWAVAEYERLKDVRQALDFDDLEARSVALLEGNTEVRSRWQSEIRAVLVDEFQDTNERQRRIVYALAGFNPRRGDPAVAVLPSPPASLPEGEGDTGRLFVVGDAKQSIYRFRGADVTVFRRVQADIVAAGGKTVDLDETFRAHDPLLRVTSALLEHVMGTQDDPARPYTVPFVPLRAHRPAPGLPVGEPYVEFHLGLGETAESGRQAAATALASRLLALHQAAGIDWGDVALLFRASTAFGAYEDAFEQAGIPFVTVAGKGFYDRPEVRDLLNALAAIADPTDDLALAGLLRSPAFGVSDAGLYQLRWDGNGNSRPLWEALHAALPLDPADAARAETARGVVDELHGLAGRVPVAEVLKRFLDLTHYRAILRLAPHPLSHWERGTGVEGRAARNVDKLLADAHRSQLVGVGEFLEYVQTLRDVAAREGEAPVEASGAVQLMTVHKAKGLEFPVVVIADAAHQGSAGADWLLLDGELGVVVGLARQNARPTMHRLAALRETDMDEAEDRRLLYVAATRAREKLIVSGHVKLSTARSDPGRLLMSGWLARLGEVIGLAEVRLTETPTEPLIVEPAWVGGSVSVTAYPPAVSEQLKIEGRKVEGWNVQPIQVPVTFSSCWGERHSWQKTTPGSHGDVAQVTGTLTADDKTRSRESDPPPRVWRVVPRTRRPAAPAWVVGTLVHQALHRWRFPDQPGFEVFLRPYAYQAGLTDEAAVAAAIRQAGRLLARFQAHPLFAEIAPAERHHEVPAHVSLADGPRSGIVDLLYRASGQWTLVEFKTDRLDRRTSLDVYMRERGYAEQVERYVAAVEQQLGCAVRALLVFLDVEGQVREVEIGEAT
jgi:ATP-dependent helicase/nuclease subunit A